MITAFLGGMSSILKNFLPDITIGAKNLKDYDRIYSTVCHELSHATHYAKVGNEFWNNYIRYILESFIKTSGNKTYGTGEGSRAGYCEIGEMWAYFLESQMYKDRYGGAYPTFGNSYWFSPQIFRYLCERGMTCREILSVLTSNICSKDDLKVAMMAAYPEERTLIEQVFNRY
jgi:hypothetical protein